MQTERAGRERVWIWTLSGAAAVLFVVLNVLSVKSSSHGGSGILSFEFVGTIERSNRLVARWDEDGREAIELSLWLDYLFLAAYALLFTLLLRRVVYRLRGFGRERLAVAGESLRWAPVAAAGFDAIENAALLLIVNRENGDSAPLVATASASVKFLLLTALVGYLVAGAWIVRINVRARRADDPAAAAEHR